MNRLILAPAVAVLLTASAYAVPASAATGFGVTRVSVADPNTSPAQQPQLLQVSVGHHPTYDRVVFRFSSRAPGYDVRYVPRVLADPSGTRVSLSGNAFLAVTMHSVASAQVGKPAAPQGRQRPRFPELRELAGSGDFEGHVSFGLGLTAKTGFRAFTLRNPDRLVVDVRVPPSTSSSSAAAPAATPAPAAAPQLADTGAPSSLMFLGGVALVLAGVVTLAAVRPRLRRAWR
jgi:hypothetical protein